MSLARKSRTISTLALIISNCVPLVGVLFFHWDQIPILMLYWFENVAIGFYTLLKLRKVGDTKYTIFFLLHYGLFTYGHFQFLFVMLSITSFFTPHPRLPSEFGMKFFSGLAIPTMALFVSQVALGLDRKSCCAVLPAVSRFPGLGTKCIDTHRPPMGKSEAEIAMKITA